MAQIIIEISDYEAIKAKAKAFDQLTKNDNLIFSTSSIFDLWGQDELETDFYININAFEKLKFEIETLKSDIDKYIEEKDKITFDSQLNRLKRLQLKLNSLFNKRYRTIASCGTIEGKGKTS